MGFLPFSSSKMVVRKKEYDVTLYSWTQVRWEGCYLFRDIIQGSGEDSIGTCFPSKRPSHQHQAMMHNHHLINLQDLLWKEICHLQVHLLAVLFNGLQRSAIVWFGEFYSRKKIWCDSLKRISPVKGVGVAKKKKKERSKSNGLKLKSEFLCSYKNMNWKISYHEASHFNVGGKNFDLHTKLFKLYIKIRRGTHFIISNDGILSVYCTAFQV